MRTEDSLGKYKFVRARDETSGKDTYWAAGYYLDLIPEEHRTPEGKGILDFNKTYNPWCAYSENYVCPLDPQKTGLRFLYAPVKKIISPKEGG